mgnify:FL=1|tara:strand:+ start:502 stop:924 length:423 start_codon:yes stop_codon:yes gene_type:complete
MPEKFEILLNYVKDLSSETPDAETYLFVRDNLKSYNLNIDIISKAIKNNLIEVNTKLIFEDKNLSEKKSYFEIIYVSIVKIKKEIKDKKEMEKIVLCDVQNKIYPKLESIFINLLKDSGFPGIKIGKKIDFDKLYNERFS